jgi:ribonuclease BN (tRNA processing enzyme)
MRLPMRLTMRLTTVGTGAAAPDARRVNAGYLVRAGDVRLLLDCGSGVVHRMAAIGADWSGITHLAITHFDADHVSDIATLFVAWRWGQLPPRSAPITVIGPPGTRALFDRLAAALWDKLLAPGYEVRIEELAAGGAIALGDVALRSQKVPHTDESVAYSVEHDGRRLVYTGDTAPDDALGRWAAGCVVLLAECSLPDEMAVATHLTPERVGRLAAIARPGRLVLTHFYPPVERVDIRALVAQHYAGPVELAQDGWQTEI